MFRQSQSRSPYSLRDPSDTSISSATHTTSTASSAFPSIDDPTRQILQEIIEQLPQGASTFVQLFAAYKDVLKSQGLDPSEDAEIYGYLLKLGMQRGADWRVKWQGVLNSNSAIIPAGPSLEGLKHRLDKLDLDVERQTSPRPARIPAKGGAPVPSTSRLNALMDDWTVTPKSAKRHSAPHPLTSTPRTARTLRPAYAIESPVTPAPEVKNHPISAPRVHFQSPTHQLPTRTNDSANESYEDGRASSVLESFDLLAAYRFRASSLLGGAFDKWMSATIQDQSQVRSAAQARDTTLARRLFAVWKLRKIHHDTVLRGRSDIYNRLRLLRFMLDIWRKATSRQARLRWEGDMRSALDTVRSSTDNRLLSVAWEVRLHLSFRLRGSDARGQTWRLESACRRIERQRALGDLATTLDRWRFKFVHVRTLEKLAVAKLDRKGAKRAHEYLNLWHRKASLACMGTEVESRMNRLTIRRCWQLWEHRMYV